VKNVLSYLQRHKDMGLLNVVVFSSRRGGSTWFRSLFDAVENFSYADEPFSNPRAPRVFRGNEYLFSELTPEIRQQALTFMRKMVRGDLIVNRNSRVKERDFWRKTGRLMIKIVGPKYLYPICVEEKNFVVFYLLRHPMANVHSIMKSGWPNQLYAYLDSSYFTHKILSEEERRLSKEIVESKIDFDCHVLEWCFEYASFFRLDAKAAEKVYLVFYERLVFELDSSLMRLCDIVKIDQSYLPAMKEIALRPSRTFRISHQEVKSYDFKKGLSSWRKNFSKEQEARCFEILGVFGIKAYSMGSDMPNLELSEGCKTL